MAFCADCGERCTGRYCDVCEMARWGADQTGGRSANEGDGESEAEREHERAGESDGTSEATIVRCTECRTTYSQHSRTRCPDCGSGRRRYVGDDHEVATDGGVPGWLLAAIDRRAAAEREGGER